MVSHWHTFNKKTSLLVQSNIITFANYIYYTSGGCPFGRDEVWNITWPATSASSSARQKCPGNSEAAGENVYLLTNVLQMC